MKSGVAGALASIDRIQGRIAAIENRIGIKSKPPVAFQDKLDEARLKVSLGSTSPGNENAADVASLGPRTAQTGGSAPYRELIQQAAARHGVDPALVRAVVSTESGGNPSATSPAGAMGLMQLMPGTARSLGVSNAYDPKENIEGGTKYLASLTQKFGLEKGLAAYNAGPGTVSRFGGIPPYRETQNYVSQVLKRYNQFSEE
jgi:soluble lytic murein transglycosylase-like protein